MELELKHLAPYLPYGLMVQLSQKGIFNLDEEFPQPHNEICEITNILKCNNEWQVEISEVAGDDSFGLIDLDEIIPLLLPMSSLYTKITHNGKTFIPQKELDWGSWNDEIGYIVSSEYGENPRVAINVLDFIDDYYKLLEWHFDVFGLIDKGLALDKTKIK